MEIYSTAQKQRLVELNADKDITEAQFESVAERNSAFKTIEKQLVKENRNKLKHLMEEEHIPLTLRVEDSIEKWLTEDEGYTRVATPIILNSDKIKKMNIDKDDKLRDQIFWLNGRKCLRPMLAPNLYEVMRDIHKISNGPVKIFEAGSCFRKESQGAQHMNEFTMLNLVELASVEEGHQMERLEELAHGAMKAVGINNYELIKAESGVYIETLDIEVEGVEVASGSFGPHPLDANWGGFDPWVGIVIGLERLAMVYGGYQTIKRAGKSTTYVNGIPLKL
ncbi:MAG: pyrrolysine--tRNA(Pyl) ligase large subunit [Eubacteriales bacterium]|nr:pyrrolysine--tRNA(Pyl) ligase large subunit [Eubacteriales bacterium]